MNSGRFGEPRGRGFRDRRDAGRALAERLLSLKLSMPVVVALPRGGVPVGYEVARAIGAPLDVGLVRKLGAPGHSEYGIGAIAEGGTVVLDDEAIAALGVTDEQLENVIAREQAELERRRNVYRGDHPPIDVRGRTVLLIDDGIATGLTAAAAARALRLRGADQVFVAVPVCPSGAGERFSEDFDGLLCLVTPPSFGSVGAWYEDFSQTPDDEVIELLRTSRRDPDDGGQPDGVAIEGDPPAVSMGEIEIATSDGARLKAEFRSPEDCRGVVVFVHGSGSSRLSPRNTAVARSLEQRGFGTLLFDLLMPEEEADRRNVFDIGKLTLRLVDVTTWLRRQPGLLELPIGYFGASTGAAAALSGAALRGKDVAAVVSRGGRPDLAGKALPHVESPTLLIVGGDDREVIKLNEQAASQMRCEHELAIVPGAGHLFEEPGTLGQVMRLAGEWLEQHLAGAAPATPVAAPAEGGVA